MSDPTSIDPSMLSDDDRDKFLPSDGQRKSEKADNATDQQKGTVLKVPEGKFASPERDSRARRVLGHIEGYEFYRPLDIDTPDALDLYAESPEGERFTIAKTLIDFDDSSNSYEVDTHKYHYYKNRVKEFNEIGDMTIGTGNHARAIKDLGDKGYALIDPLNRDGVTTVSVEEVLDLFAPQCVGKEHRDNFFYIV